MEWQMRTEALDDEEKVTEALQEGWEPYAAVAHPKFTRVFFKRYIWTERGELKSSARHGDDSDPGDEG